MRTYRLKLSLHRWWILSIHQGTFSELRLILAQMSKCLCAGDGHGQLRQQMRRIGFAFDKFSVLRSVNCIVDLIGAVGQNRCYERTDG